MNRPNLVWALRRLLVGHPPNGELEALSGPFLRLARHLSGLPVELRRGALDGFLCARDDADELIDALAAVDPLAPPPATGADRSFATLADIAKIVSRQPWLWRGWVAAAVLNAVAAEPGTGKTRFALDLARRLWFGLSWPDGQPNEWPAGTRTLWVQGDRAFAEMLQAARDFGLPDDAVALGASPDDPTEGLNLDDPGTLTALAGHVQAAAPALVVIDTVGMVTDRNLCRPEEARAFFAPIMELASKTGVAFIGLTHLSKDKEALGRRIVEKARVVIKMTQPDPDGQPDRRRLWVDKTAVVKPSPLGITMKADGNDYDFTPPNEPEAVPRKRGPSPEKLDTCKRWLAERLTPNPARVKDVRYDAEKADFSADTLYKARDALGVDEYQEKGDRRSYKWWKLPETSEADDKPSDTSQPF